MREIKFRAFSIEYKFMKMFDSHKDGILYAGGEFSVSSGYNSLDEPTFEHDVNGEYSIMQYTGLKDKTGVEIYEGDIVEKDGLACEVIFSEKAAKFCVRKPSKQYFGVVNKVYSLIGCKVIGDKYTNPELLES